MLVSAGSVYRVTRGAGAEGAGPTRVEFGGEAQRTPLTPSELAALLRAAGALLIELTRPEGTPIPLSVSAITSVRDASGHGDPPGTRAIVAVAGHRQAVQETQQQVGDALDAAMMSVGAIRGRAL